MLVLVPAICLTLVYGVMMSGHAASTAAEIASAKLGLLENRLASAFEVLREAGLSDSEYYLAAYRRSAVERFAEGLRPGEGFLLLSPDGAVLDGAVRAADGVPGAAPPHVHGDAPGAIPDAIVLEDEGSAQAVMPVLGPRGSFISWRRSEAFDWILVFAYQRSVALAPSRAPWRSRRSFPSACSGPRRSSWSSTPAGWAIRSHGSRVWPRGSAKAGFRSNPASTRPSRVRASTKSGTSPAKST